jgi:SM-20-related protein
VSPVLDLAALGATRLQAEPYEWGYLEDAIEPESAAELGRAFPATGFWRLSRDDGEKYMQFRIRPLVPLGAAGPVLEESLPPVWRRFAEDLLSPAYRCACARLLGRSLEGALLEASIWRWGPDAELGAHLDIPRKVASQVFHFNDAWDPAWGGCLRVLRSRDVEDVHAELPPELGSASLIVRSERSWHAVPRVRSGAERLTVVATWQHPGSESPFWTIDEDGSVRCHAAGSSPEA